MSEILWLSPLTFSHHSDNLFLIFQDARQGDNTSQIVEIPSERGAPIYDEIPQEHQARKKSAPLQAVYATGSPVQDKTPQRQGTHSSSSPRSKFKSVDASGRPVEGNENSRRHSSTRRAESSWTPAVERSPTGSVASRGGLERGGSVASREGTPHQPAQQSTNILASIDPTYQAGATNTSVTTTPDRSNIGEETRPVPVIQNLKRIPSQEKDKKKKKWFSKKEKSKWWRHCLCLWRHCCF